MNYELVRKGLAVFIDEPKGEFKKYEKQGFNLYNKNSLMKYIYLLSLSRKRINKAKSLLTEKYQKGLKKCNFASEISQSNPAKPYIISLLKYYFHLFVRKYSLNVS